MKVSTAILFCVLVLTLRRASTAHAQGAVPPEKVTAHISALHDRKWWIGEAVMASALALDAQSTCHGFTHGLIEGGPLSTGTNRCAKVAVGVVVQGALGTALYLVEHKLSLRETGRGWRALGYIGVPAIASAPHFYAAVHNYRLTASVEHAAALARIGYHEQ
jgi:hypothetical protein